jgi:hypothetical protein
MQESVTYTRNNSILNVAVTSRAALPVHPWNPSFSSEQAIVKWPLVTRLLGLGLLKKISLGDEEIAERLARVGMDAGIDIQSLRRLLGQL